jgi:patatin-related protein
MGIEQTASAGTRSCEIRLGIVMYGGVSLAIYINGVAHELFRAVRGRGVYKLLKAITDSEIVVDVISGTSAGGINGILLGYALCNGKEFGDAAPLWREHGDLGALLRPPDAPVDACTSVLQGEPGYHTKIEEGLLTMRSLQDGDDDPSPVKELDLFVTGTDVDGVVRTVFDDAGHAIDVKDHQTVFVLKHRAGRRHPFSSSPPPAGFGGGQHTVPALAKLARITSCFPVAFEPVKVVTSASGQGPDALLAEWGGLTTRGDTRDRSANYFLDGGVLDNKPFTYTLGAIFSRSADVAVERSLLYVEPDPESFARRGETAPPAAANGERKTPNVIEAALAALVTIPGYESISDDLKLIGMRNNKIQQYNRVVSELQKAGLPAWEGLGEETRRLHTRARLVGLTERVVEGVLNRNGVRHLMTAGEKDTAKRLIGEFDTLVSDLMKPNAPAETSRTLDAETVLADFDVYFRQRRLYRIVYLIHELRGRSDVDPESARRYAEVLAVANRLLQLYEIIRWAMEGLVDDTPFTWEDARRAWGLVNAALAELLDDGSPAWTRVPQHFAPGPAWLAADQLTAIYADLKDARKRIGEAIGRGRDGAAAPRPTSFLRRADRLEAEIIERLLDPGDRVRAAHDTFRSLDALVYPLQLMSGVLEKDVIKTVRVSPVDAQKGFSRRLASDKISGDALHHFGGFLKASWRSNDILWGRLDGLCQLVETIVTPERLETIGNDDGLSRGIARRLAGDLDPAELFPRSGPVVQQKLEMWLRRLFDTDKKVRQDARAELSDQLNLLIEAAQLEIIHENLEDVIRDSLKEQGRWNAFKVDANSGGPAPGYDARRWRFKSSEGPGDPLVAAVAAAVTGRGAVESLVVAGERPSRPSGTGVGKFFTEDYRVGSEGVRADIPPLMLLETGLNATLILRKCLIHALARPSGAGGGILVRSSGLLLRLFHFVITLTRRAPEQGRLAGWAIGAAATALLLVGIWPGLTKGGFTGWTVFIICPLLTLVGLLIVARFRRKQGEPRLEPSARGGGGAAR